MQPRKTVFRSFYPLFLAFVLVVSVGILPGPAQAGSWFKVAGGWSGMAMDDINNGDFRFYDYTVNGYNFPDLNSGFSLSYHLGYDLSPEFGLGFSWDNQYARVSGTDEDITADLNLDANFFMIHGYWSPLKTGAWSFGLSAGLGIAFPDGKVKISGQDNVNYSEGETSGSSTLALEGLALANWAFGGSSSLELTLGYRSAVIDKVVYQGATVVQDDGSNLELDYTGYVFKAGYKYVFGSGSY